MQKNEFIKQIRKKYKMSQKAFAELLEVSKSLIEKVEMGKIEATPENKYVKAVCALEGLDNEIFSYDEITDEILQKHELSKFSKAFRKFLYFYYGDFWNEDIDIILHNNLSKTIESFTYFVDDVKLSLSISENFPSLQKYITDSAVSDVFGKESERLFIEIMLIISLSKIYNFHSKPSQFEGLHTNEYFNFLKNDEEFNNLLSKVKGNLYEVLSIDFKRNLVIKELSELEDKGVLITIENIKKLKKQKELEKIQNEVIPAPTDPKDKQICELLQYAPPAFKDKIIEKLLQYKKDVEEF